MSLGNGWGHARMRFSRRRGYRLRIGPLAAACLLSAPASASPTSEAEASLLSQLTSAQGARDVVTVAIRPALPAYTVPARSGPTSRERRALEPIAEAAALQHGVSVDFFKRLIRQESGYNPFAVSFAGAQGIAQFMPATAAKVGLDDPFDPVKALPKSAEHIADLRRRLGNEGLAAAAYNAGEGRVRAWLAGRSGLPLETQNYVRAITGRPAHEWAPVGTTPLPSTSYASLPGMSNPALPAFTRLQSAEWQLGAKLLGSQSGLTALLDSSGAPSGRRAGPLRVNRGTTAAAVTGEKALCASMGRGCIVAAVY